MIVETERLRLRPITPDDRAAFRRIYGDPAVMQFMFGGAKSPEESDRSVLRKCEHWRTHGYGLWAALDRATGAVIGHCGLGWLEPLATVEVAYLFDRAYWGRGLATEGVRAALAHGFERLGQPRILAIAPAENTASLRVMNRCGMRFIGERTVWERVFMCHEATNPASPIDLKNPTHHDIP